MKAYEKLVEILTKMGMETSNIGDDVWHVEYKGIHILINSEATDIPEENYLNVVIPGIYDITDENRPLLMKIVNDVNSCKCIVKAYEANGNELEIAYEQLCLKEPDEDLVLFILDTMVDTYQFICDDLEAKEQESKEQEKKDA